MGFADVEAEGADAGAALAVEVEGAAVAEGVADVANHALTHPTPVYDEDLAPAHKRAPNPVRALVLARDSVQLQGVARPLDLGLDCAV